ncbi:hypothetical protein [Pontibacter roseus]|uniref:hypothetical protein n=1 Tax=Pontibacter roseus TaxID=336989 RepID=UPI0003A767F4|nr:hypothetical protein [Pontibacter roseus]
MKIRYLLLALYEHKYNGKLYEVGEVFASSGIRCNPIECREIARTLEEDGLVKTLTVEDTVYAQISTDGVEFLDENNFFTGSSYLPQDRIKPLQREVLGNKLDELCQRLRESSLGKVISDATLDREMAELRSLLNLLGRRSWVQILKGKVYELATGKLSQEEINHLLQDFDERPTLQGVQVPDYNI